MSVFVAVFRQIRSFSLLINLYRATINILVSFLG